MKIKIGDRIKVGLFCKCEDPNKFDTGKLNCESKY